MRRLLATLAALALTIIYAPTASAARVVAGGLTLADAHGILELAHARWPGMPCAGVTYARVPARTMRGMKVALDANRRCTILFNAGARQSATRWCHALYAVYGSLAAGSPASPWPYDCTLAVGPRPTRPRLVSVPGLSAEVVQRAHRVADAHWTGTGCTGREQLRWATPAQLAAGSGGEPGADLITLGMARPRDPRCVMFLNASVSGWTPVELCTVIEHEFGHLKGLGHVPKVDPVMAAIGARSADCEAAFAADAPAA